jgi:hypothetical protein
METAARAFAEHGVDDMPLNDLVVAGGMSKGAFSSSAELDHESHAVALDRNQLGAMLVAARIGPPVEHALISLLALNGLRSPKPPGPTSSISAWNAGTRR